MEDRLREFAHQNQSLREGHTETVTFHRRTSFGNRGASASNFPMFPSLNVKRSFLIQSCGVLSSESRMGCMSCDQTRLDIVAFGRGMCDVRLPARQSYRSYPPETRRCRDRERGVSVLLVTDLSSGRCMPGTRGSSCNKVRNRLCPMMKT